MKKSVALAAACLFAAVGFAAANQSQAAEKVAAEPTAAEKAALAAVESELFVSLDAADVSDNAKAAETLIADGESEEGGAAKCWGWYYRPAYYYYPTYYYYSWYCPCYYVPFRLVTYTVPVTYTTTVVSPVTTAVTTTVGATTTAVTETTTETALVYKASKTCAKGAVIDGKIPDNSPLKKMGLRSGDIVIKVDGNRVDSLADVQRAKAGSEIVYIRGNQIQTSGKQILVSNSDVTVKNAQKIDSDQLKAISKKAGRNLYQYYDEIEKNVEVK